jgi:hypothetical protein
MNRKLIFLNVALVVVVVLAGVQLRKQWKAAKQREAAKLGIPMKTLPVPKYDPLALQPPLTPAGYVEIAKKMLFDRSRDSSVEVPLPPPPPPPPPMPPLPVYHGLMNFGSDGPIALLSLGGSGNQAIHPGDKIGQFKLLAVNSEVISFEWNGQTVQRNSSELGGPSRGAAPPQEAGRTEGPAVLAPVAPPLVGPGAETRGGARSCNVNDGNAAGAVVDGYRKVAFSTPFGQSCSWEPAK